VLDIINMRSPMNVKEVQRLTREMAPLSRFLSKGGDRGFPYFQCLRKNECFIWTKECEEDFAQLKDYLSNLSILSKPIYNVPLYLYLIVIENVVSTTLVQEVEDIQRLMYFLSKVLHVMNKDIKRLKSQHWLWS